MDGSGLTLTHAEASQWREIGKPEAAPPDMENGNGFIFGGWTMFWAFEKSLQYYKEITSRYFSGFMRCEQDVPEFCMNELNFDSPGFMDVKYQFTMKAEILSSVLTKINFKAVNDEGHVLTSGSFSFSPEVLDYTEKDLRSVREIMFYADMIAAFGVNNLYQRDEDQVAVTRSMQNVSFSNIGQYRLISPDDDGIPGKKLWEANSPSASREDVFQMIRSMAIRNGYCIGDEGIVGNTSLSVLFYHKDSIFAGYGSFVNTLRGTAIPIPIRADQVRSDYLGPIARYIS